MSDTLPEASDHAYTDTNATTETDTVTVVVSNTYACGRESGGVEHVRYPHPDEDIDEWWVEISTITGDGHPCGATEHALYEVDVIDAPLAPHLVGENWSGEG